MIFLLLFTWLKIQLKGQNQHFIFLGSYGRPFFCFLWTFYWLNNQWIEWLADSSLMKISVSCPTTDYWMFPAQLSNLVQGFQEDIEERPYRPWSRCFMHTADAECGLLTGSCLHVDWLIWLVSLAAAHWSCSIFFFFFFFIPHHLSIRKRQANLVAKAQVVFTPTTTISLTLKMIWWRWLIWRCNTFVRR